MMPPAEADAEKVLTDWLSTLPQLNGWDRGTVVAPGVTPVNFVQVRLIGGAPAGWIAHRSRLDVRMWSDGRIGTEGDLKRTARQVVAEMRRAFPCRVVLNPTPMPDPVDRAKTHVMFTVELLIKGVQE